MAGSDRLTELEIALTHQEALLEELNEVVRAQADALDLLRVRVERLTARLADRPDNEQLTRLRAEVLNLLALSFGLPEAERRLQAVQ